MALDKRRSLGVAAEMSFWLFCGLLPLAFSTVAFVGLVAGPTMHFSTMFAAVPPETRALVGEQLATLVERHRTPSLVSILVAVWLGSSGIHAIFDGFEAQLDTVTTWRAKRLRALVGCFGLGAGSLGVAALWSFVAHAVGGTWLIVGGYVASAAVLYLIVAALYLLGIPKPLRSTLPRAPGTVLVVAVVTLVGVGYRVYLGLVGDGSAYQAGLSVVVITLTALYLFSLALLVGLAVNRMVEKRRAALTPE